VIKTFNDFEMHKKNICYDLINEKINTLIGESQQYLIHGLQTFEKKIMESEVLK
jgi:hypothetical protein